MIVNTQASTSATSTNILKVLGDSGDKVNAAGFSDSASLRQFVLMQ
jgi:hypothetical protein